MLFFSSGLKAYIAYFIARINLYIRWDKQGHFQPGISNRKLRYIYILTIVYSPATMLALEMRTISISVPALPFQNEYVADSDKKRAYITGFSGSAGTRSHLRSDKR